ncbi:MAG: hypothetical protein DKT66_19670 [Candidatus Melainabacteria bacterium]|nr:MAG: hypothetical protein DKT66_19670 [Candidatus Melainabacteria bacterium]
MYEKRPLEAVNLGNFCHCVHVFVIDFLAQKSDSETSKAMRWFSKQLPSIPSPEPTFKFRIDLWAPKKFAAYLLTKQN